MYSFKLYMIIFETLFLTLGTYYKENFKSVITHSGLIPPIILNKKGGD